MHTSMHDALLTKPGAEYPFDEMLRVAWADGVYEFTLSKEGTIVAADRCHEESSKAVLDSFAVQLAGGETPER